MHENKMQDMRIRLIKEQTKKKNKKKECTNLK